MKIFQPHLSFKQLADYVEDRLPPRERAAVEAHIASCSRCSGDLARLNRLTNQMRNDPSEDAPPSVIARAIDLFRSRFARGMEISARRRRVLAVLRFDSFGLAPTFGVRAGKPAARQMLFSAGAEEIDLRIEPAGQSWLISGQVLGESWAGGIALLQGAEGTSETTLNTQGEFILPPVEAGTYKLILTLKNVEAEIEEIRIGL